MNNRPDPQRDPPTGQSPQPQAGGGWVLPAAIVLGVIVLVALVWSGVISAFSGDAVEGLSEFDRPGLVYNLTLLTLVVASVVVGVFFGGQRIRVGTTVKYAAGWIGIVAVLALGYSYRSELGAVKDRVLGEFLPYEVAESEDGTITVRRGHNGHFLVDALVDGVTVRFMVDTGASDVTLSPRDAQRLGFDPARLAFTRTYSTANGLVSGAPVRVGAISVGPIRVRNVRASVNGADMRRSLLGLSFLDQLAAYEVAGDTLTLRR